MNEAYKDLFSQKFLMLFPENRRGSVMDLVVTDETPFIDVFAISQMMNIKVLFEEMEESGSISKDKNETIIRVNKFEGTRRQRFTIAHEIGHLIFSNVKGVKHRAINKSVYEKNEVREEITANNFAADLLMPEKLVKLHIRDWIEIKNEGSLNLDEADYNQFIFDISERLLVSKQALEIRLNVLGVM